MFRSKQGLRIIRVYINENFTHVETLRVQNLITQRFGRLVVKHFYAKTPSRDYYWLCGCDCGNDKVVCSKRLKSGRVTSCGCLNRELARARRLRHGACKTPIYNIWSGMIRRCERKQSPAYRRYGGRGIKVCKRWHKFENFYADMGNPPTKSHSIDRINNDGNYCKKNCRWATSKEQAQNRRSNRIITFRGESKCLSAWAEKTGIAQFTILNRIYSGWSVRRALFTPVRCKQGVYDAAG